MHVTHDATRSLSKVESPDRRCWTYVDDRYWASHPEIHPLVETALLEARQHGVNGLVELVSSWTEADGLHVRYEPTSL
jgi:hypothetical protein